MNNNEIKIAKSEKKKITIFLDVDSVISDWLKSACKICNIDINNKEVRDKLKEGADLNHFLPENEIWDKLNAEGESFWLNLELLPWANKLYKSLKDTGHKVFFCTSPGKDNPIPATPKIKYLHKNFKTDDIIIVYDKSVCAGVNKILIDDSRYKIKPFKEAGGTTFLWPNQFKLMDDGNVDDVIKELLNCIKEME